MNYPQVGFFFKKKKKASGENWTHIVFCIVIWFSETLSAVIICISDIDVQIKLYGSFDSRLWHLQKKIIIRFCILYPLLMNSLFRQTPVFLWECLAWIVGHSWHCIPNVFHLRFAILQVKIEAQVVPSVRKRIESYENSKITFRNSFVMQKKLFNNISIYLVKGLKLGRVKNCTQLSHHRIKDFRSKKVKKSKNYM